MGIKILVTLEPVEVEVPEDATPEEIQELLDKRHPGEWKNWKFEDEWRN